jgi:ppGpp synthetase/RelA/SpoT-type nucleotidyltranferase
MNIIQSFLNHYRREYSYYDQVSRICGQQCEALLDITGIRTMVTHRAKRPDKLEHKLYERTEENPYGSIDDIYNDILDLAGVRIALYFPGDINEVEKIIRSQFILVEPPRTFPDETIASRAKNNRIFPGYHAVHYHVKLKPESLSRAESHYSEAVIEIQVASVLMHAWSEVEHDLVYKPLSGKISDAEEAILDELNGLVLAGEIALKQLQNALKTRVSEQYEKFNNHYELASYLYEMAKNREPMMGSIDILFELMKATKTDSVKRLAPYIGALNPYIENRPIAEQIIDEILADVPGAYSKYNHILRTSERINIYGRQIEIAKTQAQQIAVGSFMERWIELEEILIVLLKPSKGRFRKHGFPSAKRLASLNILNDNYRSEIDRFRHIRSNLVHGIKVPSANVLNHEAKALDKLIDDIRSYTSNLRTSKTK